MTKILIAIIAFVLGMVGLATIAKLIVLRAGLDDAIRDLTKDITLKSLK